MSIQKIQFFLLTLLAFCIYSCSETKEKAKESPKEIHNIEDVSKVMNQRFPNERSELAILMRDMLEDLKTEKQLLTEGKTSKIAWSEKYGSITTAKPTDQKHTGPDFKAFGTSFLTQLKAYENATKKNQIKRYNNVITSCMSCHKRHCPGPMMVIRKLPLNPNI